MARNPKPWFKLLFRDWMESQRVRRMHPAAQGIYLRALCFQAMHGALPEDRDEIAICLQIKPSYMKYWDECLQHFTTEVTADGETVLYNEKQRELLEEVSSEREARRRGAEKTNAKRDDQSTLSVPLSDTPTAPLSGALRASVSDSISNSQDDSKNLSRAPEAKKPKREKGDHLGYDNPAFCQVMDLWPRKLKRAEAYSAYRKNVKSDSQHQLLMDRSRAVLQGEFAQRKPDKIPYLATWINGSDWRDAGADLSGSTQPPAASQSPSNPEPQEILPSLDVLPPDRWENALHALKLELPTEFDEWLAPLNALAVDGTGTVYVTAPSEFHRRWVASNYRDAIEAMLNSPVRLIGGEA